MQPFLSQNLGVRRLAVVLSILGAALTGVLWSAKQLNSLAERRWDNKYFRAEIANRPELALVQHDDEWYLMDNGPHPEWEWFRKQNSEDWRWRIVEHFPITVDRPPARWEYLIPLLPALGGAVLMWLIVHTIAWVVTGFRRGDAG